MSVRGPCGRREGGDGLYPWTGLSCKECVALVESQDLRPGCGGHMALGRSTRGSPKLRVGADAAKALSGWSLFSSPRPHLRRRGGQNSSTVVQGPHGWWRPGWLCIQPGPLLTQAAAACCQSDRMLSFLRCLSQVLSARCCRVVPLFHGKHSGTEKSRREVRICQLPHFPAHQPAWMKPHQWPHSHSESM